MSGHEQPPVPLQPTWYQLRLGAYAPLVELSLPELAREFAACERRLTQAREMELMPIFTRFSEWQLPQTVVLASLFRRDPAAAVIVLFHLSQRWRETRFKDTLEEARAYVVNVAAPAAIAALQGPIKAVPERPRPVSFDLVQVRSAVIAKEWGPATKSADAVLSVDASESVELSSLLACLVPVYGPQIDRFQERLLDCLKQADPTFLEPPASLAPELIGLFDGMGGADGDRIASHVAAFALGRWSASWQGKPLQEARWQILNAFSRTHQLLVQLAEACAHGAHHPESSFYYLGTTALLAQLFPGDAETEALVIGVGDSFAYQYIAATGETRTLVPVTAQEYLGTGRPLLSWAVSCQRYALAPGDRLLLASDGYEQLTPTDMAINQTLANWDMQQSIVRRLTSTEFFLDWHALIRRPLKLDDRSIVELARPCLPQTAHLLLQEKTRALEESGFLLPEKSKRQSWNVPLDQRLIAWRVLRAFSVLKHHVDPRFRALAIGADGSPRHTQEAIWRLGQAAASGRLQDQQAQQVWDEIFALCR